MEFLNFLYQYEAKSAGRIPKQVAENYLLLLSPVAPHLAEELWEKLGHTESIFSARWPEYDPKILQEGEFTLVVQINGKLRARMQFPLNTPGKEIEKTVLADSKVRSFIEGKKLKRIIYVPGRLINLVVE